VAEANCHDLKKELAIAKRRLDEQECDRKQTLVMHKRKVPESQSAAELPQMAQYESAAKQIILFSASGSIWRNSGISQS